MKIIFATRYRPCCLVPINTHPRGYPPPKMFCDSTTFHLEVGRFFQNLSSTHWPCRQHRGQIRENYQPPGVWTEQNIWLVIAQFQYFKIQHKTMDLSTRLQGINDKNCGVYSPEPRSDVYCFMLNFKISK